MDDNKNSCGCFDEFTEEEIEYYSKLIEEEEKQKGIKKLEKVIE